MSFDNPIFQDKDKAREHLEAQRWANGRFCPHCGETEQENLPAMEGKSHRAGLYQCKSCRKQFTVTVGTVFERSKVPLNKWLYATHLMCASKKGISAHQIHRMIGVTYKTAWFMCHRIREAMKEDISTSGPMGGEGKSIEADEMYHGRSEKDWVSPQRKGPRLKRKKAPKRPIVGLVERGGKVRTFHVKHATKNAVRDILVRNADRKSKLYTDESPLYKAVGKEYGSHKTVKHSAKEYARREGLEVVHSNTIENVFSIFKRGMFGTYQHCGEAHLHRYLAEFDFRYNRRTALKVSDTERRDDLLAMIYGKRLTYRRIGEARYA